MYRCGFCRFPLPLRIFNVILNVGLSLSHLESRYFEREICLLYGSGDTVGVLILPRRTGGDRWVVCVATCVVHMTSCYFLGGLMLNSVAGQSYRRPRRAVAAWSPSTTAARPRLLPGRTRRQVSFRLLVGYLYVLCRTKERHFSFRHRFALGRTNYKWRCHTVRNINNTSNGRPDG